MNLYKLHDEPWDIHGHSDSINTVPEVIWDELRHEPLQLQRKDDILAKDPKIAFKYHSRVLHHNPFPKGEKAILNSSFADAYKLNLKRYAK